MKEQNTLKLLYDITDESIHQNNTIWKDEEYNNNEAQSETHK